MNLNKAFRDLRKAGMIAKQRFSCCQSCAAAALDTPENKDRPAVFYTKQDAEVLDDDRRSRRLYLTFGVVNSDDNDRVKRVGAQTVEILQSCGLKTSWDGDINNRICIELNEC